MPFGFLSADPFASTLLLLAALWLAAKLGGEIALRLHLPAVAGELGVGLAIAGAVLGSVLFRELVAIALSFGLNPNDLKLVTAVFVFAALILPDILARLSTARRREDA